MLVHNPFYDAGQLQHEQHLRLQNPYILSLINSSPRNFNFFWER